MSFRWCFVVVVVVVLTTVNPLKCNILFYYTIATGRKNQYSTHRKWEKCKTSKIKGIESFFFSNASGMIETKCLLVHTQNMLQPKIIAMRIYLKKKTFSCFPRIRPVWKNSIFYCDSSCKIQRSFDLILLIFRFSLLLWIGVLAMHVQATTAMNDGKNAFFHLLP